jgi:hypothetical protein
MGQYGYSSAAGRIAEIPAGIVQRAAAILDAEIAAAALPSRGSVSRPRSTDAGSVRFLEAARPATAGETVDLRTRLQNDEDVETDDIVLAWTDLVATASRRIPSERVSISPNRFRIPPGSSADVAVTVQIPIDASPGHYRGVMHDPRIDDLWVVLAVQIE